MTCAAAALALLRPWAPAASLMQGCRSRTAGQPAVRGLTPCFHHT